MNKETERRDLIASLVGEREAPEISPVSWLKSGIDELEVRGPRQGDDDPDTFRMMIDEMRQLHVTLSGLMNIEHGQRPVSVTGRRLSERTERPADDGDLPF